MAKSVMFDEVEPGCFYFDDFVFGTGSFITGGGGYL